MTRPLIVLALIWALTLTAMIIIVALLPVPARAQTVCAPARKMAAGLLKSHGEEIVMTGTTFGGTGQVIVMAGPGGSFSILIVRSDGMACMVAAGEDTEISKYVRGKKL